MTAFQKMALCLPATLLLAVLALPTAHAQAPAAPNPLAVVPDAAMLQNEVPADHEPSLTRDQEIALLRQKVKYVFVLYQENRSFDSYFATFPGADGLYSQPPSQTPGFSQTLIDTDGKEITIKPFRIGPKEYASDLDDMDHAHSAIFAKMDVVDGAARMDRYAITEERRFGKTGNPSLKAKQFGELVMAHVDGDTIPFLWRYANRFVLFDHIFQLMTGPSTPGNLAIIGAQTGATQWMLHPDQAYKGNGDSGAGVPVLNDAAPFWGSPADTTLLGRMPVNPGDSRKEIVQYNLTYATLPLTLSGKEMPRISKSDRAPKTDLPDVADDIAVLGSSGKSAVPWGWYQEGFGNEPANPADATAGDPVDAAGRRASYITHHDGPQYFGYIANNPKMNANMHGLTDFFDDVDHRTLPANGGLFYVKGGSRNILGYMPVDPDPKAQANFRGDDDHPGYSDSQISEALLAHTINKIANSPYWKQCAIIITWDDSDGQYDHVPPPIRTTGPDGSVISDGARVPLLLLSPYAKVHAVDSDQGDHASVVKFADVVFGLTPLADLPDERRGRAFGELRGLKNEGPFDDLTPGVSDLLSAFDPARLAGKAAALPASYVEIPEDLVHTLPQKSGYGWRDIGVLPTDYQLGIPNEIPADFNARPRSNPTQ